MRTSEHKVPVRVPAAKIWAFFADCRNWGELLTDMGPVGRIRYVFTPQSELGAGAKMKFETIPASVEKVCTVMAWNPPQQLSLRIEPDKTMGSYEMNITILIEAASSLDSIVHLRTEFEWKSLFMKKLGSWFPSHLGIDKKLESVAASLPAVLIAQ